MNERELKDRSSRFMAELGLPLTRFCQRVQLSRTAICEWRAGRLKLADDTLRRIDNFLTRFGY